MARDLENAPEWVKWILTGYFLVKIALIIVFWLAWLAHVTETFANGDWFLLLVGAVIIPIGVINGIGVSLGAW